jgi:hypothetical protein
MPVVKFRTFDDAARALVHHDDDDRALARRIAALWEFSARLAPSVGFRGVRKYVSVEEADEDRRRMIIARGAHGDAGHRSRP